MDYDSANCCALISYFNPMGRKKEKPRYYVVDEILFVSNQYKQSLYLSPSKANNREFGRQPLSLC
jgi:hypothetical protein